jgi:hypothetical protein
MKFFKFFKTGLTVLYFYRLLQELWTKLSYTKARTEALSGRRSFQGKILRGDNVDKA